MIAQNKWSVVKEDGRFYLSNGEKAHLLSTRDPMTAEKLCDFWNWRDKKNADALSRKPKPMGRPRDWGKPLSSSDIPHLRSGAKIKITRTLTGKDWYEKGMWVVNHEEAMVRVGSIGTVTEIYNGGRDLELAFDSHPDKRFVVSYRHCEGVGDE
jgi:hypothetical protein